MNTSPLNLTRLLNTYLTQSSIAISSAQAAQTVIRDSFDSNSGSLNNRLVETPQTALDDWGPGDGSAQVTVGGQLQMGSSGTFAKAAAPFDDSLLAANTAFTMSID